jgi:hypothetical protein
VNQPPHNPFEPPPAGSYGGPTGGGQIVPTASESIASLVCGLLTLSCFPLGIVAIWLGVRARRQIRENPDRLGGDTLALVGMIVGAIFLGLWLLYFCVIFAAILIGALKR